MHYNHRKRTVVSAYLTRAWYRTPTLSSKPAQEEKSNQFRLRELPTWWNLLGPPRTSVLRPVTHRGHATTT
jgi:hypothetical protein